VIVLYEICAHLLYIIRCNCGELHSSTLYM